MRVLVTGGRDFNNCDLLARVLDCLHNEHPFTLLIHGAAKGADRLAGDWASNHGIEVHSLPADWKRYGRAAGPIRNRQMLEYQPDLVVAFPGGKGTADMVRAAVTAGLRIVFAEEFSV